MSIAPSIAPSIARFAALAAGAVALAMPAAAGGWRHAPRAVVVAPVPPPYGVGAVNWGAVPVTGIYARAPFGARVPHPYPRYRRGPSAGDIVAGALVIGTVAAIAASASRPRGPAAEPGVPGTPGRAPFPNAPGEPGGRMSALAACADTAEASAGPGARTVAARERGFEDGVTWVEGEVEESPRSTLSFSCGFDGQRITEFRFG
jgi:hypothetical protein